MRCFISTGPGGVQGVRWPLCTQDSPAAPEASPMWLYLQDWSFLPLRTKPTPRRDHPGEPGLPPVLLPRRVQLFLLTVGWKPGCLAP